MPDEKDDDHQVYHIVPFLITPDTEFDDDEDEGTEDEKPSWPVIASGIREVWMCKGPPLCDLIDDDAVAAQKDGCPLCKHTIVQPDGTETVVDMQTN